MNRFLSGGTNFNDVRDRRKDYTLAAEQAIEKHLGDIADFQETIFSELVAEVRS